MSIQNLDPQVVWKNFYALTQIPRPSKHEEKAVEFMYNWGKEHGLETIKDEVGNIIMRSITSYRRRRCIIKFPFSDENGNFTINNRSP